MYNIKFIHREINRSKKKIKYYRDRTIMCVILVTLLLGWWGLGLYYNAILTIEGSSLTLEIIARENHGYTALIIMINLILPIVNAVHFIRVGLDYFKSMNRYRKLLESCVANAIDYRSHQEYAPRKDFNDLMYN